MSIFKNMKVRETTLKLTFADKRKEIEMNQKFFSIQNLDIYEKKNFENNNLYKVFGFNQLYN